MTAEQRLAAVAEFGFTPRQARFLTLVMRHAGVCLLRQYSTFAGIVHGQKTRAFFRKLVSAGYASASRCRHNRGRLYHVHHYALYRAIGAPNSSHRRPVPAGSIVLRSFISRHTDLIEALPLWTLRLVFPRPIADAYAGFQAVVRQELESPLHPRTVEELTWYFGQLRAMPSARVRLTDERFERAAAAFYGPRFSRLYRQWLRNGDGVLERITSTAFSDALASDAGRIECQMLSHRYDHLSPVVDTVESNSTSRETGMGPVRTASPAGR